MEKKYWRSIKELKKATSGEQQIKRDKPEFSIDNLTDEEVAQGFKSNRRNFLKALGFTIGYASLATSCQQPVRKAIPYMNKPEEVTPGVANHYASTYFDGHDFCSVLVKVREGRPIKIEGNELFPLSNGGTNARVQASVLSLYDSSRLQNPEITGIRSDWETVDKEIVEKLSKINAENGKVVLLTSSLISPSTRQLMNDFKKTFPATEIITYDSISYSAMLHANEKAFGIKAIPRYRFDKADVILGINADFLATWLSPTEFAGQYSQGRDLLKASQAMSKHYQVESYLSATGTNADERMTIKPSEERAFLMSLYNQIAAKTGNKTINSSQAPIDSGKLAAIAESLMMKQSKSLVVCGTNDYENQVLCNAINAMLKNVGNTIDFSSPTFRKSGDDKQFREFVERLQNGKIDGVILHNVNPVYDSGMGDALSEGLNKTALSVSFSRYADETSKHVHYSCPDHHYLESWNDAEPYMGYFTLTQPCLHPIFDTRQAQDSLLKWMGSDEDYHDYIKKYWQANLFEKQKQYSSFTRFWKHSLQNGFFVTDSRWQKGTYQKANTEKILERIIPSEANGLELQLYENTAMGAGSHANNPWLQELPDPVSKVTWGNYVAVSPYFAKEKGLKQDDVIQINGSVKLPVHIQPGQPREVISIALGYGRKGAGKTADGVGANAYVLLGFDGDSRSYFRTEVDWKKTGETLKIASTQDHHSMEGREMVKETNLKDYKKDPASGNHSHALHMEKQDTLYPEKEFPGSHWGMSVDLNKCIGCGACIVACQAENNIPVVGKEEVINRRIMHWIRIDRYFTSSGSKHNGDYDLDNPEVVHQPVMCQHCDNAPCENVCPVAATPHTKEGLNSMAYNRCIGTRYCMNNCPYSVRRFNWYSYSNNDRFDFNQNDKVAKLALNPDVVVRERGVVEKCSFCVQRIQEKKLEAKKEGRALTDGEVQPACVQACPTKAITFGDYNQKDSKVNEHVKDPRAYGLLEELHTLPSVSYLTQVRNNDD